MKQHYALSTSLILLVFLFNSCCRSQKCKCEDQWGKRVSDCSEKQYGPFGLGEIKEFMYFKPGTWWVYQNDLSGQTDSVYVVQTDTAVQEKKGSDKPWLSLTYTSLYGRWRSDKFKYTIQVQEPVYSPDVTDFVFGHRFNRHGVFDTAGADDANFFTTPYRTIDGYVNTLPTLTVKGETYSDVVVFQVPLDETVVIPTLPYPFNSGALSKYYWAKGFGIVMIESHLYRPDTQTTFWNKWELLKSNIIQ